MQLTHRQAVITMVASTLMWSIAGVVTRHLDQAHGFEVTFWRSFFTMVSLMVILPVLHGRDLKSKFLQGGKALWVSGLCWSVMFTAFMMALTMTTVANVLVTMAVGPLLTALLARVLIGHRLAFRTTMAIAVGGLGIAYMYADQLNFNDMKQVTGMLVALCVPAAAAVNWTLSQRAQAQGRNVDLVPAVLIGAMISSLVTLPFAIPIQATTWDLGLLATLGLVQLAIPCSLAVVCARYLTAPEISLLALLEIIFGILLAWWGAGEVPAKSALLGGCLVIGALVFNEWLSLQERKQSQLNQIPLT
ncbi:MAG TPA: DMT family transporter [Burkholderiaceae bacterium]|nr:DMT family transporter [Burkholderiaceae bacterium]